MNRIVILPTTTTTLFVVFLLLGLLLIAQQGNGFSTSQIMLLSKGRINRNSNNHRCNKGNIIHPSTLTSSSTIITTKISDKNIILYMASEGDKEDDEADDNVEDNMEEEVEGEEDEEALTSTSRGPVGSVDTQLGQDLKESKRRIGLYEAELGMLKEQLQMKQDELLEERTKFQEDKDKMMELISDLSKNLAQRYEELEARQELMAEFQSNEVNMKLQIADLKQELETSQTAMNDKLKELEESKKLRIMQQQYREQASSGTRRSQDFGIIRLD